mgnify:CR=1 FL=1
MNKITTTRPATNWDDFVEVCLFLEQVGYINFRRNGKVVRRRNLPVLITEVSDGLAWADLPDGWHVSYQMRGKGESVVISILQDGVLRHSFVSGRMGWEHAAGLA